MGVRLDQKFILSQLESHLWESANILRGPVDAADFKTYIFPLLFFKRICDVWDEEFEEIVADTGDAELALFPESHRFQVPDDCHWNSVRTKASNVGAALQRAMREIEKAEDWTLNISRYVLSPLLEDIPPLPKAIAAFKETLIRCREAEYRWDKVMVEGG